MAVVRRAPSRDEDGGPRSHVMGQRRGATGYRGRSGGQPGTTERYWTVAGAPTVTVTRHTG
jgi:hypothetical protein